MNIASVSSYPLQTSSVPGAGAKEASGLSFKSIFGDALSELNAANAQKEQDTIALATGNVDDIAAISANSLKAETMTQLLVQVRNSLLDSYQEIMRLNV
ncbi:MAG: flagellar hook-basal body complex protein FliE [Oscillospiraceae bacterium]|jgi:flagellar hook-basal body complex protein FliE|nr:flagellar hook-basal body complex protein FliE [Oscillospiraceae bacterium]